MFWDEKGLFAGISITHIELRFMAFSVEPIVPFHPIIDVPLCFTKREIYVFISSKNPDFSIIMHHILRSLYLRYILLPCF